jgi:hypothetical protein
MIMIQDEIQAKDRTEDWTVIFGTIYDVDDYASVHPGGPSAIREYVGEDASKLFSRRPPADLPLRCLDVEKDINNGIFECDEVDRPVHSQCHTNVVGFSGVNEYMGGYERGVLAHRLSNLNNDINTQWIMIYKRIYNRVSSAKGVHLAGILLPVTKTEKCTRCAQGIARYPI